jgi:hypothetical protein
VQTAIEWKKTAFQHYTVIVQSIYEVSLGWQGRVAYNGEAASVSPIKGE